MAPRSAMPGSHREILGPLLFVLLFFAHHISPRNPLSPLGVETVFPPQFGVLAFSAAVLAFVGFWEFRMRALTVSWQWVTPVLVGTLGISFTFSRSLEATGLSRPTLDLASMLLLPPLAYLAGTLSDNVRPWMLWGLLSLFTAQLLWAWTTGPNDLGAFTFYSVNSIEFGVMMGTATVISAGLYLLSQRWSAVAASAIFLAGVITSNSRGALLATVIGLLAIFLSAARGPRVRFGRSLVPLIIVLGGWLLSAIAYVVHRSPELVSSPPLARTNSSSRLELWERVFEEKFPSGMSILWGSGDSYIWFSDPETMSHPHNFFLIYGVTGGLLGLSAVSFSLLTAFGAAWTAGAEDHYSTLLASLLVVWAIHLQFSGNFGDGANILLIAGFVLGRLATRGHKMDNHRDRKKNLWVRYLWAP